MLRSYAEDSKLQMVAEKVGSAYGRDDRSQTIERSRDSARKRPQNKRHSGAATSSRRDRKTRVGSNKPQSNCYRSKDRQSLPRSNQSRSIESFRERALNTSKPSVADGGGLLHNPRYDKESEEGEKLSSVGHRRIESIGHSITKTVREPSENRAERIFYAGGGTGDQIAPHRADVIRSLAASTIDPDTSAAGLPGVALKT